MEFDPKNPVVMLCAKGMDLEGQCEPEEAGKLFIQAWEIAGDDFEKFTSAHYVARHQKTVSDKLKWDETALQFALKVKGRGVEAMFPSLYLNIAKCYEELQDLDKAKRNYEKALSFTHFLQDDGYGKMIKAGILNGIERVNIPRKLRI